MARSRIWYVGAWITDRLFRGLVVLAQLVPYERRVALVGSFFENLLAPLAGYRRRAEKNLKFIWPEMPETERRRIAARVCNNFGRTLIENYSPKDFKAKIARCPVRGDGLAAIEKARTEGRAVLFVTGHFGNHEAPRQALTLQGFRIGGLFRPMANPFMNNHYAETMTAMSGDVFAQGKPGTFGFVRMLRNGGMGTLLFDVRVTARPSLPFLGKPAGTATSAAEIALRTGALIVPYFGIRAENGTDFDIVIEAPIDEGEVDEMMRAMTARLEAHVEKHPDQWFWVHNRWGAHKD